MFVGLLLGGGFVGVLVLVLVVLGEQLFQGGDENFYWVLNTLFLQKLNYN